jgi:putative spermidine/putrescine transport system permease protein
MRARPLWASHLLGSAVLAFLLLPVIAVIPASFNHTSFIRLPPEAVSLRWYGAFFADAEWLRALIVSIEVAVVVTLFTAVIGTLAALGIERAPARLRSAIIGLVLSPLIVPVIMTSIALYYIARPLGLHGTVPGLALGHALLALPFVVLNVGIALRGIDPNCLRAAEGLGAAPWFTFRTVTLPLIAPALAGGAAFAFITSFDEVVISIFLSGAQAKTLPVKMWEVIRVEFTPVTAVASTLLVAVTLALFLVALLVKRIGAAKATANG